ncbi:MAG: hypothetical protein RIS43_524 [Actinomycetota bacterium]
MKRLFWFSAGLFTGAIAATRLSEKVKRDGILVTVTEAQAWAAPKVVALLKLLTQGGRSNGIG